MIQHRSLALFAISALLALASCSKNNGDSPATSAVTDSSPLSNAGNYGNIYFDAALTPKERGAFVTALAYLDKTPLTNASSSLLNMMRIDGSAESVRGWLEDRVEYIISDDTDASKLEKTDLRGFAYPNPGVYGNPNGSYGETKQAKTVMQNISPALYDMAKRQLYLWQLNADGLGEKLITSPRAGILVVGEGLLMNSAQYPNYVKIFQLGTLLHEARHSDGNGKTTGFYHANCTSDDPDMAPYKGHAACDHATNGAYTIGALATEALMDSCDECSLVEKNALYGLYLDYKSRVIQDGKAQTWDDAPEGQR